MDESGEPKLHFQWDTHLNDRFPKFNFLFQQKKFVDVMLVAAEGRTLKAHRLILSASSQYLEELLSLQQRSTSPMLIISLRAIKFADLKALVDYMYKGELYVSYEQLPSLLEAAAILKMKDLIEQAKKLSSNPDDLSDTHKSLQLKLCESSDDELPSDTAKEIDGRSITEQKKSLINDVSSPDRADEVDDCQPAQPKRRSHRVAANPHPTHCYEKEDNSKEGTSSDDSISSVSSNESSGDDDQFDQDFEGASCSTAPQKRKASRGQTFSNPIKKKEKDNSSSVPAASERPYKCERCENTYKLKKHLNRHRNQECDPNSFPCTLCKFKANRQYEPKTHLLEFHQIESSQLPKFITGRKVQENLFKCKQCENTYKYKNTLRTHLKFECRKDPSFPCTLCDHYFSHKGNLRRHLHDVHAIDRSQWSAYGAGATFQCELCQFYSRHDGGLRKHILSAHKGS